MGEHVWDRFLTEEELAHVRTKASPRIGFGQRPALLLIDLYRWVFGDEPQPLLEAVEKWPGSCGLNGWRSLPHIQRLLATARAQGIPVIHTTGLDEPIPGWAKGARAGQTRTTSPEMAERRKRMYDIIDEVAPLPNEVVIRKSSPSCFWGTPLMGHLTALGIDTVIVGGESTSGCVRAAVVDGCSYRLRMMVVEECVFDRHPSTHALNLFDMHQKYADVLSLQEVLSHLDSITPASSEKKQLVAV